jgi:predicted  nucleic acid-binding Zn-ribbon protein
MAEVSALEGGLRTRENLIGKLNVEIEIREEQNAEVREELTTWKQEAHDKSMKNLDLSKRVRTLETENHDLQASVGRLSAKAAEELDDGLRDFIRKEARKVLEEARDAYHDNSWLEGP